MLIGVISDTHIRGSGRRQLPPRVWEAFAAVDCILHAGDLVVMQVLHDLQALAPVSAVHGNMDDPETMKKLPATRTLTLEGVTIGLAHGHQGRGVDTLHRALANFGPIDCLVFGHSHQPIIQKVEHEGRTVLAINPGSATDRRFGPDYGVALLTVDQGLAKAELVLWQD